jgi:hypothetical protein
MDISFYLPTNDLNLIDKSDIMPRIVWRSPALVWVYITYLKVKKNGLNCHLTDVFPKAGIVVSAGCTIPLFMQTSADVCHICTAADSPLRFYPQIHVLQNKTQHQEFSRSLSIPTWVYIPHWSQPELIPRDVSRGDSFENIGYLGSRDQLATELQSEEIQEKFRSMGLKFHIIEQDFHNYSQLDAVIAVRSFDSNPYLHKPASKLVNAWMAGVPAILSSESAFRSLRQTSLDYLEVKTPDECFQALQTLHDNPNLRLAMIKNGHNRSKDFSDLQITERWLDLLKNQAPVIYESWINQNQFYRMGFHADQYTRRMSRSLLKRLPIKYQCSM